VEPILLRPRFLIFLWALRFDSLPRLRGSRIFTKFQSRKERSMPVARLTSRTNLDWRVRGRRSKTSLSPSRCRVPRLQNKSND
jgi:hypothetical protein